MRIRTGVLLIILIAILTRMPLFWDPFIHSDEALFALSAKIWSRGGIPFLDWIETKPLGVYLFYSLGFRLGRDGSDIPMRIVHMASFLWTVLTAGVIGGMASRLSEGEKRWKTGLIAAIFFVLYSSFWDPTIVAVHIEVVLLLPLCLSLAVLFPSNHLQTHRSFLSGLFASAAILCKYQAGILVPVILIYMGFILPQTLSDRRMRQAMKHCLSFILGCLPLPLLMMGYLKWKGGWEGFLFWNFLGNYFYIRDGTVAVDLGRKIVTQVLRYVLSTALLWYLMGERLGCFVRQGRKSVSERASYEFLIWIWFFLGFLPVSVGKRFEDHYFLFLTPALCILGAAALVHWSKDRWRKWGRVVLVALLLPAIGFTVTRYFLHPLNREFDGEDMNSYRPYADFLRERTGPHDPVFVWGCGPAIYLFADRMPSSRFLRTDVLAGRVSGADPERDKSFDPRKYMIPETWAMFFEDMRRRPPTYIMDIAPTGLHDFRYYPMFQYPQLMEFVKQNYIREADFQGAVIYHRKEQ